MIFGYLMHREIGRSNPEENIKNVNGMLRRATEAAMTPVESR